MFDILYASGRSLLMLRYRQAGRLAYALGTYAVFGAFGLIFLLVVSHFLHQHSQYTMALVALWCMATIAVHTSRKDLDFMHTHLDHSTYLIGLEYFALMLPFLLCGIGSGRLFYWLPAIAVCVLLPHHLPSLRHETRSTVTRWIPSALFEWKSGLRKMYYPFMALYTAALLSSWFKILPLILLWFLTTLMVTFYDENESLDLLREGQHSEQDFLHKKLKTHLGICVLLYLPILTVNTLCNPDYVFINAMFIAAQLALLFYGITTKYAFYIPVYPGLKNSNITAMVSLLAALPVFFFLPLVFGLYNYRRALTNLKPYFDHD
ncbi:MAG: hypothetical protein IPN29_21615 [Saprospiraceae bacterium]|nr:hypothetical protein [Saprospiraceae bacterium]